MGDYPVRDTINSFEEVAGTAFLCRTEEDANNLLSALDSFGVRWAGSNATPLVERNRFNVYGHETVYYVERDRSLMYGSLTGYKEYDRHLSYGLCVYDPDFADDVGAPDGFDFLL